MGIIQVLEKNVADLIAAGEVVERPASVVKELIENAIDAGASSICVEIRGGGISYIRVTDNGKGIAPDDVGVAFMRHATSKISTADDLAKIGTLGFRGEALCSIAAVAKVTMTTKTKADAVATRVLVAGGEMEDVSEVGAPNGTTIEVENLFYNTPARMKFLKKDTTEGGYVADIVQKFVLVNPHISFKFIQSGKQVFFSPGDNDMVNAIYTVYGKDYASNVIPIEYGAFPVRAYGYIGKSQISRPNRACQSFFVNGRYIKSRSVTVALEEAYRNQLMGGKFPFAVICLEIAPEFMDVNVHPHKTEVKFSDEKKVFDTVYWAVKNALYQKPVVPEMSFAQKKAAYKLETGEPDKAEQTVIAEQTLPVKPVAEKADVKQEEKPKPTPAPAEEKSAVPLKTFAEYKAEQVQKKDAERTPGARLEFHEPEGAPYVASPQPEQKPLVPDFSMPEEEEATVEAPVEAVAENPTAQSEAAVQEAPEKETKNETVSAKDYKIVGQLFSTYIILEKDDTMLMLDQHAAHERIRYEELKAQYDARSVARQCLLDGTVVTLSAAEYAYVSENKEELAALGFEFEEFGGTSLCLNTLPQQVTIEEAESLFAELIGQMMTHKRDVISEQSLRALYTIACKAAIKANQALNEAEVYALIERVLALENINTCPHGRPIMVSMTKYEIEKQFKRIV